MNAKSPSFRCFFGMTGFPSERETGLEPATLSLEG